MSSIAQAFKNLALSAEDASDHESIYEVSYEYLSKVKNFNDVKSFHNCVVSLINMDKYQQAYELIKKVPEDVHSQFSIEKAYVYYKLAKSDLLAKVYEQRDKSDQLSDRALKHVVAQDCYRKGDNATALKLIHELIKTNSQIDSDSDLGCNERAVLFQLKFMESGKNAGHLTTKSDEKSYDCLFNDSLILIANNQLGDALKLLDLAQSVCTTQNQDLDAGDLLLELAPIKLTIAYIYQVQGRISEAKALLDEFRNNETVDHMTKLVTTNNYYALEGIPDSKLSIALRDLDYQARMHKLQQKLTKPQLNVLMKNKLLLQFHAHALSKSSKYFTKAFTSEYQKLYPGDYTFNVYKVLNQLDITISDVNDGNAEQCARKLYQHAKTDLSEPERISTTLLLVAVNNIMGRYDQCLSVLEKIWDSRTSETLIPALAGTLFGLLNELNYHQDDQRDLLSKTKAKHTSFIVALIKYFQDHGVSKCYNFAREIAFRLYQNGDEKAEDVLRVLQKEDPQDRLVAAALDGDNSKLDKVETLQSSTDINELLSTSIASMIPAPPATSTKRTFKPSVLKVHKNKRKPRFSAKKEFVAAEKFNAADLDEERWLPMRLRSYYKPTKKDRKKGGQQGALEQPKDKKKKKSKK